MVIGKKRGALLPSCPESVESPMTALRQGIWHHDLLVCAIYGHLIIAALSKIAHTCYINDFGLFLLGKK